MSQPDKLAGGSTAKRGLPEQYQANIIGSEPPLPLHTTCASGLPISHLLGLAMTSAYAGSAGSFPVL
ncbi:hypothetical protein JTE90_020576 [Oedothorax gibbosus]|uniref:Uncharacterized protein n=1 Tax=Oedothorax gibbosus TaxID=931172 RepID=A0AAV6VVF1_9ARAC|nr:hypothetical protein JTE90_020576 [Oedothorax gibbosus]